MQRKFIEYDLPLEKISEESAREKNIHHGHPSTLHIWWARKPLAVSRAVALATLLEDPGSENSKKREKITELIKKIAPWEAVKNGNSKDIQEAQRLVEEQYGDSPPKVLDPFAGGGSIPLETLRMGAETYSSDYNPVAVFIEKVTVEWPQKFGIKAKIPESFKSNEGNSDRLYLDPGQEKVNLLTFLVERWANKVLDETKNEIGKFYPEESGKGLVGKREVEKENGWIPVGYYYNRTIPCQNPNCEAQIPLNSNYWIAKKKNKRIAYAPRIDRKNDKLDFKLLEGGELKKAIDNGFDPSDGTVTRANATCPVCGQVTEAEQVRQLSRDGNMDQRLIAVVFHHPEETGKKYRLPKNKDFKRLNNANKLLEEQLEEWASMENPLPNENMVKSSRYMLPTNYGMEQWYEIFNDRQLLAHVVFLKNILLSEKAIKKEISQIIEKNPKLNIEETELLKAINGYLGNILNMQAAFNNTIVRWENTTEAIKHSFSRAALPMIWDYVELNPFSGSSGSIESGLKYYIKYIDFASNKSPSNCTTERTSATDLPYASNYFDAVITDPPYYDNVPYGALSDFFYVWLKNSQRQHFPNLFSTPLVPKTDEATMEPERHESKEKARESFEEKLSNSFQEIYRVLKDGGIATVVYAHKTTAGWETMLNGLVNTGFIVTASWPVHTEMKNRLRAAQSASLASSIYMVCKKSDKEKIGFWKDVKPKISEKVEIKLKQFWEEGIIGGDLFISAIGPGMEIFSQYEEVQKYSGEKVSTRELLTFIRSITTDFVVNRLLQDASPSEIDKESQFYLAYRWTYLDNKVEYDAARKIASGMGVDIEELDDSYGFVKKTRKYVRVYSPEDRTDFDGKVENIEVNTMVDAMHKSLLLWEDGRKEEINELLAETGYAEQGSFWQFCQAVSESLVQGNDEKKKLEGFLMGRDKYVQSAKEMNQQDEKTKDMFEEE